ncbi:MAG: tyrosine-type recombinase/integrase [Planctomycetota bacterium]|jgi:integrase
MTKTSHKAALPGSIYLNRSRWWWKVKLPGETKPKARPLKPLGAKFATPDRTVAEEVAREIWQRAVFKPGQSTKAANNIAGLVHAYLGYAKRYYRNAEGKTTREPENIRYAVKPLVGYCPTLPLEEFGPLRLKKVQQKMIEHGWCRNVVNQRIGIIKRMFKWAASEQLIPASVYHALQTVEGLKRGRSGAKETEAVLPVAESYVRATLPFTAPTVAAMIELQLLTGMRSGELVIMQPCDLETGSKIWLYRPSEHKTQYRGHERVITIGPRGQMILKPFLKRKLNDYCFLPEEAEQQRLEQRHKSRQTPLKYGNRPGINRKGTRIFNKSYDTASYRRAVHYSIKAANKAGINVPYWTPHQLRHTAATRIRKEMGLDAARAMLGHRNLKITDDYAELDRALASEAALKYG